MAKAYSEADLIICRAGALTVTEVATAGVAAVFVPLPIAVDDHQTANAKFLADVGAAKNLPAIDYDTRSFKSIVYYADESPITYRNGSESASTCPTNATQHVVDLIQKNVIGFTMSPTTAANQAKTD